MKANTQKMKHFKNWSRENSAHLQPVIKSTQILLIFGKIIANKLAPKIL